MNNAPDELHALWDTYTKRIDASLKLNTALLARANLDGVQSAVRPMLWSLGIEGGGNAVALVLIGSFAADNIAVTRFAVPAIVLGMAAMVALLSTVRQMVALQSIDFGQPVVAIRRAFERLQLSRIRTTLGLIFASPLLWVPLLIVGLRGMFGVDAYAFGSAFLIANLVFGAAVLGVGALLARRLTAGRSRLGDLLAGRSLRDSLNRIDAIERFAEG